MSACSHAYPEKLPTEPAQFFDSGMVETLIGNYQQSPSTEVLGEIIVRCEPVALSLIRWRHTFRYEDEDELLSSVRRKLCISVPQFDRTRGSAFSFVSRLTVNMLATRVTLSRKLANRYQSLDDFVVVSTPDDKANFQSTIVIDDLSQQIHSIKSPCTLESEREAQRWFTESFIDSGFTMSRHQYANAAMRVFGLGHRRAREIYDLTLLEIRRVLWDETRHTPLIPANLKGTKGLPRLDAFPGKTSSQFFNCRLIGSAVGKKDGIGHLKASSGSEFFDCRSSIQWTSVRRDNTHFCVFLTPPFT